MGSPIQKALGDLASGAGVFPALQTLVAGAGPAAGFGALTANPRAGASSSAPQVGTVYAYFAKLNAGVGGGADSVALFDASMVPVGKSLFLLDAVWAVISPGGGSGTFTLSFNTVQITDAVPVPTQGTYRQVGSGSEVRNIPGQQIANGASGSLTCDRSDNTVTALLWVTFVVLDT